MVDRNSSINNLITNQLITGAIIKVIENLIAIYKAGCKVVKKWSVLHFLTYKSITWAMIKIFKHVKIKTLKNKKSKFIVKTGSSIADPGY